MAQLSVAWGLVAILALALYFLWLRADRLSRKLTHAEIQFENAMAAIEAMNEQAKKDKELNVLDDDSVADNIVLDSIKKFNTDSK